MGTPVQVFFECRKTKVRSEAPNSRCEDALRNARTDRNLRATLQGASLRANQDIFEIQLNVLFDPHSECCRPITKVERTGTGGRTWEQHAVLWNCANKPLRLLNSCDQSYVSVSSISCWIITRMGIFASKPKNGRISNPQARLNVNVQVGFMLAYHIKTGPRPCHSAAETATVCHL